MPSIGIPHPRLWSDSHGEGAPGMAGVAGALSTADTVGSAGGRRAVRSAGKGGRTERQHREARSLRIGKKGGIMVMRSQEGKGLGSEDQVCCLLAG